MSVTNIERIQDYFRRQYELEEGSVEDNIRDLFAEDAVVRLDNGDTLALEDIARAATVIRQIPKSERIMEVSDLKEEGDTVAFHSSVRYRNPDTGKPVEMDSDAVWRFNDQGQVVESRSTASIVSMMQSGDS
jgi:ketosteroid isomerase-like protein